MAFAAPAILHQLDNSLETLANLLYLIRLSLDRIDGMP
jgi:hypothetical protein